MCTTTIRLEEDLQARIAAAAEREGKTAHAFIVDAIVRTAERSESDDALQRKAEQRWAELRATASRLLSTRHVRTSRPEHGAGALPAPRRASWPADTRSDRTGRLTSPARCRSTTHQRHSKTRNRRPKAVRG